MDMELVAQLFLTAIIVAPAAMFLAFVEDMTTGTSLFGFIAGLAIITTIITGTIGAGWFLLNIVWV